MRADAQRALDLTFERCMLDEACNRAFPAFENDFYDLLARLQEQTVQVEAVHPTSGERVTVAITPLMLATTTRLMSYSDMQLALLPLMIRDAYQGNYSLLASQYLQLLGSLGESLSTGMYYAVWCSEDLPNLPPQGELGMYYFDPDMSLSRDFCGLWQDIVAAGPRTATPTGPADRTPSPDGTLTAPADQTPPPDGAPTAAPEDDYPAPGDEDTPGAPTAAPEDDYPAPGDEDTPGAPTAAPAEDDYPAPGAADGTPAPTTAAGQPGAEIDVLRSFPRTDIPVLLISGEVDPITPPANGDQVAEIFTNSLHIVLPGMAHANFYVGCIPTLLRDFLEAGSPLGLDPACTQLIRPMPFFLSPIGPNP
jgi:pimeloyl-ACP methyl ester carboxylesterase